VWAAVNGSGKGDHRGDRPSRDTTRPPSSFRARQGYCPTARKGSNGQSSFRSTRRPNSIGPINSFTASPTIAFTGCSGASRRLTLQRLDAGEPRPAEPLGDPPKRLKPVDKAAWREMQEHGFWLTSADQFMVEIAASLMAKQRGGACCHWSHRLRHERSRQHTLAEQLATPLPRRPVRAAPHRVAHRPVLQRPTGNPFRAQLDPASAGWGTR
jgi:hypothetical protein